MPIIDVHNHFYPPEYLAALRSGKSVVRVTVDSSGNPHIHYQDWIAFNGQTAVDRAVQILAATPASAASA